MNLTATDIMCAMNQTTKGLLIATSNLIQIDWEKKTFYSFNATKNKSARVPSTTINPYWNYRTNHLERLPPLLLLIVVTVIFNLVLIVVIGLEKRLHKPANAYIFALACSDLLDGCIPMVGLMQETALPKWQLNILFCYLVALFDHVIPLTDMSLIFLMAFDRYSAIMRPLEYSKPNRKITISIQIGLAYAIPFLLWIPPVIVYGDNNIPYGSCFISVPRNYDIARLIGTYFLIFFATIYLYGRCVWGLWSQYFKVQPRLLEGSDNRKDCRHVAGNKVSDANTSQSNNEMTLTGKETIIVSVSLSVTEGSDQSTEKLTPFGSSIAARPPVDRNPRVQPDQSNKRRNALVRSMRNVGIYALAFSITIMPYAARALINNFCYLIYKKRCLANSEVISWLPYCHASVHPILYAMTQREFRSAVKTLSKKLYRFLRPCRSPK